MKTGIPYFMILITFALLSCGGHKEIQLEKEDALTFKKATYAKWVAGIKGGGAGYDIHIELDDALSAIHVLDSIYFKNFKVSLKNDNKGAYIGYIKSNENTDVITPNSNGSEQIKDDIHKELSEAIPFKLNGNEAVVVYREGAKKKYYKLNLTKTNTLARPQL